MEGLSANQEMIPLLNAKRDLKPKCVCLASSMERFIGENIITSNGLREGYECFRIPNIAALLNSDI